MEKIENSELSSIGHLPEGKWAFDNLVTDVFGDMLKRSIPNYDCMREVVFDIGSRFVKKDTYLVDLGCSKGESLQSFVNFFGGEARYIGIDSSRHMVTAARQRFDREINKGWVDIRNMDLKNGYPDVPASLTLSVLTLQFIPIEYRQNILRSIYSNLIADGAFVMIEKVLGETEKINRVMTKWYEQKKQQNGYSIEEIQRKKESLEGVLVPLKPSWNFQLLKDTGFKEVDCLWRCMNFSGWLAIK